MARILIAEDDNVTAILLEKTLVRAGHEVQRAADGNAAFRFMHKWQTDVLLTDWMMPGKDGIELIRNVREARLKLPLIVMMTTLSSPEARVHALNSGADAFWSKPITSGAVVRLMEELIAKSRQTESHQSTVPVAKAPLRLARPDILAVAVAASTGGPIALCTFFKSIPSRKDTAFLVVLHGPDWMLKGFTSTLQKQTRMIVCLGEEGMSLDPGVIYLAPGDRHMYVDPNSHLIKLSDAPSINYVKPAADPLFQSVGISFGDQSLGVVLTGLGRDSSQGVVEINKHGGKVLIQDPDTSEAPSMPQSALETGVVDGVEPLERLGPAVASLCAGLSYKLKQHQGN